MKSKKILLNGIISFFLVTQILNVYSQSDEGACPPQKKPISEPKWVSRLHQGHKNKNKELEMKYIGHRGASDEAPENTLASVKLAYEQGAYGAEIDIQLTKDKKIVLMHDDTATRTGGIDKKINDMTWDELKDLDVGSWKDPKWKGVTVPLVQDVVAIIPPGKKLFVEIKGGDLQVVQPLAKILTSVKATPEQIRVISFDHNVLKEFKKKAPKFETYFLTAYKEYPGEWPYLRTEQELNKLIASAKEAKANGFDIEYNPSIPKAWIKKLKDNGFKVVVWNYSEDDQLASVQKMQDIGIDLFTTNKPAWMKENFHSCPPKKKEEKNEKK